METSPIFEKEFLEDCQIKETEIVEKFQSRKNQVFKVKCIFKKSPVKTSHDAFLVFKKYLGQGAGIRKENESLLLNGLGYRFNEAKRQSAFSVPGLFYEGPDYIVTEYIEGCTLLERFCVYESKSLKKANGLMNIKSPAHIPATVNNTVFLFDCCFKEFKDCVDLVFSFHEISKKIFGQALIFNDMNLRNFIIKDEPLPAGKIFRVDLEDCRPGFIEEDLGKLIIFILSYDPILTQWKIKLSERLIKYILNVTSVNKDLLYNEAIKELDAMSIRRNIDDFTKNKLRDVFDLLFQ